MFDAFKPLRTADDDLDPGQSFSRGSGDFLGVGCSAMTTKSSHGDVVHKLIAVKDVAT